MLLKWVILLVDFLSKTFLLVWQIMITRIIMGNSSGEKGRKGMISVKLS